MAVLTGTQFVKLWQDGQAERAALYALRNVVAGDTADLSADFSVVLRGMMVGATVAGTAAVSISGTSTVVTMPVGLNHDAAFMLVWGCAA